jgi:hypothetical protein
MLVPEAAVDEDHEALIAKHEIGCSREIVIMATELKAKLPEQATNDQLGRSQLAANTRHQAPPLA